GLSGWRSKLASGWTLNAIADFQTGFPFTPELSFNPSNNGDTRNPDRPSWNPEFRGPVILGSPGRYFNPAAFVTPVNGTYGNAGRNILTGPGLKTTDFSLIKNTNLSEKVSLQFRAEFFNLFNTVNFNTPNPVVFTSESGIPSSTAGQITGTSTASRQIQLGLKLIW
ncbi:MAG: carboxypeptidase regulatory-like domain-containing protein, partial [Acidobacteriota bacterium]|nr:carboxypeptidase regulatory-like domain-containing protein [Acidobacteriota bacterium]